MWAWPDLHDCTGVAWDVIDFGTGALFWTAGMSGTVEACFICVASVVGGAGVGCMHGADGGNAGCSTLCSTLKQSCLLCGRGATWDSVNCLDTAFTEVPPCAVVCGTSAGVYLIAVPGMDTYHSGRNPNLSEGVIHCNWLTSIQWCKCFAAFISLCLSKFRTGINLLTDVWG